MRRRAGPAKKPERALFCAEVGVKPSVNECGGKPILPEPRSVKKQIPISELDNYGEGFVAQFNAADGNFISAVYLGGSQGDSPSDVAVNQSGDILVVGSTGSPDFTLVDPLQSSMTAGEGFLSVLDSSDLSVKFSTFLGGSGGDGASRIAIDPRGDVVIAGSTSSSDFPIVRPFQSNL